MADGTPQPARGLNAEEIASLNPLLQGLINPRDLRISSLNDPRYQGLVQSSSPFNLRLNPQAYNPALPNSALLGHEAAHSLQFLESLPQSTLANMGMVSNPYAYGNPVKAYARGKKMMEFPAEAQAEIAGNWLYNVNRLNAMGPQQRKVNQEMIAPYFQSEAAYVGQLKNAFIQAQTPSQASLFMKQPWLRTAYDFWHNYFRKPK